MSKRSIRLYDLTPPSASPVLEQSFWILKRVKLNIDRGMRCGFCGKIDYQHSIYHSGPFKGNSLHQVQDHNLIVACNTCYTCRPGESKIARFTKRMQESYHWFMVKLKLRILSIGEQPSTYQPTAKTTHQPLPKVEF